MSAGIAKANRVYLTLLAGIFGVLSVVGLVAPEVLLASVELPIPSPSAGAELRAVYFGGFLGFATIFGQGARDPALTPLATRTAALLLGCFSAARLLSLVLDGSPNAFSTAMHMLETGGFLMALSLWWRGRRT